MYTRPFVGVDWGTSSMRAMLCTPDQTALNRSDLVYGLGISKLTRPIGDELLEKIAPWEVRFGPMEIVMAGMVGSNIGWHNTGYVNCPAPLADLMSYAKTFSYHGRRISILPGARCENQMGEADVMRGEELQLLGWIANNRRACQQDLLFCLPGTHCKWAIMKNGRLETFTTALAGELFDLLTRHSVLVPKYNESYSKPFVRDSFLRGVDFISRHPDSLLRALFSTRSRSIVDNADIGDSASYLSGLLIGSDINAAVSNSMKRYSTIEIIGERSLCEKYAEAMAMLGQNCRVSDGLDSIYAGFMSLNIQ